MQKFVVCHTEGKMDDGEVFAVAGKKYPITYLDSMEFQITSEVGNGHSFSWNPKEGFHWTDHFVFVVENESDKKIPIWVFDQNTGENGDWVLMAEAVPNYVSSLLIALRRNYNTQFESGDKPTY